MIESGFLLFQNIILLFDTFILLLHHSFQIHLILEPADCITDYLSDDLRMVRFFNITDNSVLIAFLFNLRRILSRNHNKRR